MMKKFSRTKTSRSFTLLELLAVVAIFSLIAIILSRIFIISIKAGNQLESFSYEDKKTDIALYLIKKMISKIYLYPTFTNTKIEGYEEVDNYKLKLDCPIYLEKSKDFSSTTGIFRFIKYEPYETSTLFYGLFVSQLSLVSQKDKKAIYLTDIPLFSNNQINKEVIANAKNKEYLLLDDVESFKVELLIDNNWVSEYSCSNYIVEQSAKEESQNQKTFYKLPQFIKITIEKKTPEHENKIFSLVIKI
jgi:hypothetical protein